MSSTNSETPLDGTDMQSRSDSRSEFGGSDNSSDFFEGWWGELFYSEKKFFITYLISANQTENSDAAIILFICG